MVAVAPMSIGSRTVERRDAEQAPENVGDVRAEDATVGVHLVDDDVAEVLERARPARVMREDPRVEHVRVRHDDAAAFARSAARVGRRVAVEDHGRGRRAARRHQLAQPRFLVARERLRRKEVDGARVRIVATSCLEDGEVEAEALAARGRRRHDESTRPLARIRAGARAISNALAWCA